MSGQQASALIAEGRQAAAVGDWKSAVTSWIAASKAGGLEAANLVTTAAPQLKALAEAGDVDAKAMLAGILVDFFDDSALPLAFEHATAAAREGHPAALRTLGLMYRTGRGAEANPFQAEALFFAASKAGDAYAAFNLAGMHITGDVRPEVRDHEECLRLLRQAVDGGVVEAAAVLADQLSAVDRDAEALTWYVYAAEHGHAGAMFAAGCRYRDGVGTAPHPVQAVRWFLTMLDHGEGDGVHEAIQLAKLGMTDEQIRDAGRLSGHQDDAEHLIHTVAKYRDNGR
jgi:TPR repeat protein